VLEAFLQRHADSSMFLRSNARAAGLEYHGAPLQADYVAAFENDRITDVAAHCWNGVMLVQAPHLAAAVARAAALRSGRAVAGLSGPADQVVAAREGLRLNQRTAKKHGIEELFALDVAALVPPAPLAAGEWFTRPPGPAELDLVTDWRVAYAREALGRSDTPGEELRAECRAEVEQLHELRRDWVLVVQDRLVAYSAFNAALPDIVQVGGVWTPPALRGRGYGRAAVAGSLLDARARGVTRAVLFAEREDAKRAYRGIGFRAVGAYSLVLF
jgi:GNAT superfamily N-acetyltransferase